MDAISSTDQAALRSRQRLTAAIKRALRELRIQLALLNHHVGARLDLNDVDLDSLDLIARYGPLSPRALARRSGLHPATVTGILDRLERGGWVARERDPSDRRAVAIRSRGDRTAELVRLYSGMSTLMDQICAGYGDAELELLADFLRRVANAGQSSTDELAAD
jgi:DNA-binding MarR family transcriptional regulator